MCNLSEIFYEDGIQYGKDLRDKEKIAEMLHDGKTPAEIASFCKYPLSQVLAVQDDLQKKKLAVVAN